MSTNCVNIKIEEDGKNTFAKPGHGFWSSSDGNLVRDSAR